MTFHNIIYMLKFLWKINKNYCLIGIPDIILSAIFPFVLIIFPRYIIDGIMNGESIEEIFKIIILMCLSMLIIRILQSVVQFFMTKEYNKIYFSTNSSIGLKAMNLKYQDIEDPKTLDLFNKVMRTLDISAIFESIHKIISSIITIIGLIVIIASIDFIVFIVIAIIVAINIFCDTRNKRYDYDWQKEASPYQRKFDYYLSLMYDFSYGKEIRINNLKGYFKGKYDQEVSMYSNKLDKVVFKYLCLNSLRAVASVAQDLFLYGYLALAAFNKLITIGEFSMYVSAINNFSSSLMGLTGAFVDLNQQSMFIRDFREFTEKETVESKGDIPLQDVVTDKPFIFEFKNVSFQYPTSSEEGNFVLKNVSITIRQGEKLSIVGLNGAGKTTFIKLLVRLYEPTKGNIYLNGVDITQINYVEYSNFFSVVFQDFKLFAFSFEENITLNLAKNKENIIEVTEKSGLGGKVQSLSLGYETPIYNIFSNQGIEFSGGEKQKLAIARALYKEASVVILDEPTAALDPLAEYEIYEKFNQLVDGKTAVYISHRLSSTKLCDHIAVFENGEIVQYGCHDELVHMQGLYKQMFEKQASPYMD